MVKRGLLHCVLSEGRVIIRIIKMGLPKLGRKFILILFLLLVALTAWQPVEDHDFGFNVAAGKAILSTGEVPDTDHFSVAGEGRPWVNRLWGYQTVFYLFYKYFHFPGVSLFTALFATATFALLVLSVKDGEGPFFLYVFLLVLFIVQFRLRARPEMFSFFFLAGVYYLLEIFQREEGTWTRTIFLVPLIQVLWVNSHGLYVLGIMLQVLLLTSWALERSASRHFHLRRFSASPQKKGILAAAIFLSCAASFVNPFGWQGVLVPFEQFRMLKPESFFANVTELLPTYQMLPALWENDKLFLAALAAFVFLALISFVKPKNGIHLYHFFVFIAFFYLALKANRNVALLALMAAPAIPAHMAGRTIFGKSFPSPDPRKAAVILIAFIAIRLISPASSFIFAHPLETGLYPEEKFALRPINFMLKNNIPGPVFPTDLRDGNLLLWKEIKPVYDGRLEIFGEEFFRRYHEETIVAEKNFMAAMDQYGSRAVLVRLYLDNRYPTIPRFIPQRAYDLYKDPRWALLYFDSSFCLFVRKDAVSQEIVERFQYDFREEAALERMMSPSNFYHPHEENEYPREVVRLASALSALHASDAVKKVISLTLKDRP